MNIEMTQLSQGIYKAADGIYYYVPAKASEAPAWARDHRCTQCSKVSRIMSNRFTIGPKCAECFLSDARKEYVTGLKDARLKEKETQAATFKALLVKRLA